MKKCGIYKITSPSGKIYIGQSRNIEKRIRQYKNQYKLLSQPKLYNSIKKYSFNLHTFEIIEECEFDQLNIRERYWQDFYNSVELGLNCLYTKTKEKPAMYSKETREKMSKGQKGKTSPCRKTTYQFNLQGDFIQEYSSIQECAKILNLTPSGIGVCCRGKVGKYKEFYFSFEKVFKKRKNLVIKKVICIDLISKERREYESLFSTIRILNFKINLYSKRKYFISKCNKLFYYFRDEDFVNKILKNNKTKKKKIKKPQKIYKNRKKIICIEDNLEFKSITEAGKYYNVYPSSIHNQIKGLSKKIKNGKTFKYI